MSVNLTVNGVSYPYPQTGDTNWGAGATNWASAVTSGMLSKAGGSFPLTAQADFGGSFGIKVLYLLTETANPSGAGYLRLANTDTISWRNNANGGNLPLGVNTSDQLTFNGDPILPSTAFTLGSVIFAGTGGLLSQDNSHFFYDSANHFLGIGTVTPAAALQVSGGALVLTGFANRAINTGPGLEMGYDGTETLVSAYDRTAGAPIASFWNASTHTFKTGASTTTCLTLASNQTATFASTVTATTFIASSLTATTVPYLDASKNLASSAVTPTELGYVSGVTSSIQTQLNGKQASGSYITALTGDGTASGPGSVALTLATVNANVGSFGSSTAIPSFTVNAKGLVTAASTNVVIAPAGTLTGTTLASNVVSSSLTSVGTIATGVWSGTAISAAKGGTAIDTSASTGIPSIASGTWSVGALTGDVTTAARVTTVAKIAGTTVSGTTGSGNVVFSASPTVSGTLTTAAIAAAGNITFSSTSTQGVVGTTTNDSAAAGNVGEYLNSNVAAATNLPGSTGAWGNMTSKSLAAGDYMAYLMASFSLNSATAFNIINFGIGTTSASNPGTAGVDYLAIPAPTALSNTGGMVVKRVSLSTTTTVYALANGSYATSTPQFTCSLFFVRIR